MGETSNSLWVVLINRSPRGPLTEDEVRALLAEGHIRINDVAYRVPEKGESAKSDWKFLWQFQEFDRRRNEATHPPPQHYLNKRVPTTPEETQKKVEATVPGELREILPEELVVRTVPLTKTGFGKGDRFQDGDLDFPSSFSPSGGTPPGIGCAKPLMAAVVLVISGWVVFHFPGKADDKAAAVKAPVASAPTSEKMDPADRKVSSESKSSLPAVRKQVRSSGTPGMRNQVHAPRAVAPARGPSSGRVNLPKSREDTMSDDEFRRRREERQERERQAEEKRRQQDVEEGSPGDEVPEEAPPGDKPAEKKSSPKPKHLNLNNDSEAPEAPSEEAPPDREPRENEELESR